jgi:peptide/nickel transport system permease protein
MLKYIARRILIFIPTLFAISLIAFAISVNSPGDPVEAFRGGGGSRDDASGVARGMQEAQKDSLRRRFGLDLPVFYVSLSNIATPDTLYREFDRDRRASLERLIDSYGNWDEISAWYRSVEKMKAISQAALAKYSTYPTEYDKANAQLDLTHQEISALLISYDEVIIASKLDKIEKLLQPGTTTSGFIMPELEKSLGESKTAFAAMKSNSSRWMNWIPALRFYGYNQYHRWLFGDGNWLTGKGARYTEGVIRGDFGTSYASQLPVTQTISRAIPWSLFFTIFSVLLAYLVSIPIGVQAAANRGSFFDRSSSVVLFMLFSLPAFFMATLLLMTFANPEVFNLFEASGVKPPTGYPAGASLFEKMQLSWPYLVLPMICYTYSSLAFLSRTVRVSVLEVTGQDFIRTAKAKGLGKWQVIYKHGLRNALLPIITVFSNIFPAAVGGSVILEFIFGIPGMGQEIVNAIFTKDYPMIVCVFTLSGFMTLLGYLVADILYAFADPRISYSKK